MITAAKVGAIALIVAAFLATLTCLLTLFCGDAATHFNGIDPEADRTLPQKVMNRSYFSMVALSTTGFGDISPKSGSARLLVMLFLFMVMVKVISLVDASIFKSVFTHSLRQG